MPSKILFKLFIAAILLWNIASNVEAIEKYSTFTSDLIFITFDFPQPIIEKIDKYHRITLKDIPSLGNTGLPELPVQTAKILLPYNKEIVGVKVFKGSKITIPGSYSIKPTQRPYPIGYRGTIEVTLPDKSVYDSYQPFPKIIYSDISIQDKKGYRILLVNLHPVEYIPKAGKISYYEDIGITIKVKSISKTLSTEPTHRFLRRLSQDKADVLRLIDNQEVLETYPMSKKREPIMPLKDAPLEPLSPLPPKSYDYVIITNNALKNSVLTPNFQTLINHKQSRGIKATITTTEFIYANYSGLRPDGGTDNQTRIRNFIIDAYNTWGIDYVLLGGDGDGANVGGESGNNIIPSRGFYDIVNEAFPEDIYEDSNIPADMYYACLEGTFDGDRDGIYGETTDSPDLYAEVYVGRAPVDSETELANFVSKTIAYETSFYDKKALMVGEDLNWNVWGSAYKDEIKNGATTWGYTTVGFSTDWSVDTLYDAPGNDWSPSTLISKINAGLHVINHLGHSNNTYNMKMYNSDADNLTNTMYFLGYSQGCYSGSFDNRNTSSGSYNSSDCIIEHFTTKLHGAFAYVANSRYGWGDAGSTNGPSQRFDRQFWDAIFGEGMTNLGKVNQDSKEDNAGNINMDAIRWCYYELNLFGCPEIPFAAPVTRGGTIQLDNTSYAPGSTIQITIKDTDLNSDSTTIQQYTNIATLTTTGGDLESNIVMKETGTNTAIFIGTISISPVWSFPTQQNGIIEVPVSGEIITATYYDADDGLGNPAIAIATATVEYRLSISVSNLDYYYIKDEIPDKYIPEESTVISYLSVPDPLEEYHLRVDEVEVFVNITCSERYWLGLKLFSPWSIIYGSYTILKQPFTDPGENIYATFTTGTSFNGQDANGTWRLVIDNYSLVDTGSLNFWQLRIKSKNLSFRPLSLGGIGQSSSSTRFKVTNDGNISENFTLSLTNPVGWTAGTTAGNEVYVLKGLFVGDSDNPSGTHFVSDDVIETSPQVASATKFGDAEMSVHGASVPVNDSRYLWFQFQAPTATTVTTQQGITVTIGAQAP